jgi:hypothetical protein
MSATQVTLNEIMTAVRELTFDRFIIPAFALKAIPGYVVEVVPPVIPKNIFNRHMDGEYADAEREKGMPIYGDVVINGGDAETIPSSYEIRPGTTNPTFVTRLDAGDAEPIEKGGYLEIRKNDGSDTKRFYFTEYYTFNLLLDALIAEGIVVAYTPYFKGDELTSTLIKVSARDADEDVTFFRRYFFSDWEIAKMISWYYFRVLDIKDVDLTDETVGKLIRPSEQHLAIWVSYYLVDRRRVYENAAGSIGQSFTDGSDYTGSGTSGTPLQTTVQIGSVFTITEDATQGFFYEDFNRVGSDNVWGDRYSFWYRLMLYLRGLLEEQFGDYSLRKDNVIPGYIQLIREYDFRAYYDSYPFTLSPLSRGILSRVP